MSERFDRATLLDAFAELGRMAWQRGRTVEIAVYGGSALVLTYDWREATRDVDAVFEADKTLVRELAADIARSRGWNDSWLNDGVKGFLGGADATERHALATFPSEAEPGLRVMVANPAYLFAMKSRAMPSGRCGRTLGRGRHSGTRARTRHRHRRWGNGGGVSILSPPTDRAADPVRPGGDFWRVRRPDSIFEASRRVAEEGEPFGIAWREFLDHFYLTPAERAASMARRPLPLDPLQDAYLAATAEHLASVYRLPVPGWTAEYGMQLRTPHFAGGLESLKATLTLESPAAFRRRLLFVSQNALSRASQHASLD